MFLTKEVMKLMRLQHQVPRLPIIMENCTYSSYNELINFDEINLKELWNTSWFLLWSSDTYRQLNQ